jgi:hypothetical protein
VDPVKKKKVMSLVIFILSLTMALNILGVTKVRGKFMIPTAEGDKSYRCLFIITQLTVMIECEEKIFQPLNQFEIPKTAKMKFALAEVNKIEIQDKANTIYFIMENSFYKRFRNYFHQAYLFHSVFETEIKVTPVLFFIIENNEEMNVMGKELRKLLGERCRFVTFPFEK